MDINNSMGIIDGRDMVEKVEELQEEIDTIEEDIEGLKEHIDYIEEDEDIEEDTKEEQRELKEHNDRLIELKEEITVFQDVVKEADGYSGFSDGESLIRDTYFVEYAQELAEECGLINDDAQWPATCIDWEQAARELQYDYSGIYFDNVLYWMRS